MNGISVGNTSPTEISCRSQATYMHIPTGGVTRPIPMTTVISTQRTIGLIPTLMAMGYSIGINKVRVAILSMNIVTIKKRRSIMQRMTVGLVEKPSMVSAIHLSNPAVVSITV